MTQTSVRVIETVRDFERIEDSWNRLYDEQTQPIPSLHWKWFHAFWSGMRQDDAGVVTLTAWRGERMVGGAVIRATRPRLSLLGWRDVGGLENAHSPVYGWLLPPDATEARDVAGAIIDAIPSHLGGRHLLCFNNTLASDPGMSAVSRALRDRSYRVVVRPNRRPTVVRFDEGSEAFLKSVNKGMRRRLKKGWEDLTALGPVTFEEVGGRPGLQDHLGAAWRVEAASWKGTMGSAVEQDPALRTFYEDVAGGLAPLGKVALFFLRCNGEVAAFAYVIVDRGLIHGLKLSFSSRFASVSPGHLIVWKIIEWASERGIARFNLSGDATGWKSYWPGESLEIGSLYAFPRGVGGFAFYVTRVGWKQAVVHLPGAGRILRRLKGTAGRRPANLATGST